MQAAPSKWLQYAATEGEPQRLTRERPAEWYASAEAAEAYRDGGHDGLIGLGGGSAIDIAKSVAAYAGYHGELQDMFGVDQVPRKGAPMIAIPTTAGTGAEVTRNAVLFVPEERVKVSLRSPLMVPSLALVDPELTYSLPPDLTAIALFVAVIATGLISPEKAFSVFANPAPITVGAMYQPPPRSGASPPQSTRPPSSRATSRMPAPATCCSAR